MVGTGVSGYWGFGAASNRFRCLGVRNLVVKKGLEGFVSS